MRRQKLTKKAERYDRERKRRELERRKIKEREIRKFGKIETVLPVPRERKETAIKIPILKLEASEIEMKEVRISRELPHIEKIESEVNIPILLLSSPIFKEKKVILNKKIPFVVPLVEKGMLKIPLVRVRKVNVRCLMLTFDSRIPIIKSKPQVRVRVPIYRIPKMTRVREIGLFDKEINGRLLGKFVQTSAPHTSITFKEIEPSSGRGEEVDEEPPEIISFVFGAHFNKIMAEGPVVVLYKELREDSTIGSFETICMRILREKKGGRPGYFCIKKLDDFNIREIEKYIKPEGSIVRIDLDLLERNIDSEIFERISDQPKGDNEEILKKIISQKYLRETLSRFIMGGDISFLIFKTRDEKVYDHCKEVLKELERSIEHPLKIVEIIPREMSTEEKRILTELAWGISVRAFNLDEKYTYGDRPIGATLDDIFNKLGKERHERYLERLEEEKRGIYAQATNEHEVESDLHRQVKMFIVKLLSRKYRLESVPDIKDKIKTEKFLPERNIEGEYPKPDVWDTVENVVYEVETLFSEDREGRSPQKKIYDSIEKYEGVSIVEKINVVLDNLTILLHIREIWWVKKNIEAWEQKTGKRVEFFTLDLENGELIPLRSFLKKIKELLNLRKEKC